MNSLINPTLEKRLRQTILPDLDQGRKNFDRPHTEAVVYWMKHLLTDPELATVDSQVMITAAYAHDWGYIGLFDGVDSDDPQIIAQRKPMHMDLGAKKIKNLIESELQAYFTPEQTQQTVHLVQVHDLVETLQTDEEILIMEADTLGMLDADRVKPTFSKEENNFFIVHEIRQRRLPKFHHSSALALSENLITKRLNHYQQH